ncbi:hypothetical protein J4Q44_G00161580, partial [Coregonus suidteri]
ATDETEIRETESTSKTPSVDSSKVFTQSQESTSTQSPSMSSSGKPTEASTASFTEQGSGDLTIDSTAEAEGTEEESSGEDISDVSTKQPASTTAPLLSSPATTKEEFTTLSVSSDTTLETAVDVDVTLSSGTTAEVPKVISSTAQTPEIEVTEREKSSTEKLSVAFISDLTLTDDESSGDQTPDICTKEYFTATVSPVYSTIKAEQMTFMTKVSSLFSTEKPKQIATTVSQDTATAELKITAAATTGSSLHSTEKTAHFETTILEEESSGDQTPDMFTTQSAATPLSPLYSTVRPEEPELPSSSEMPSVVPIIDETETRAVLTSEVDGMSSGSTIEMFTKEPVATTASPS